MEAERGHAGVGGCLVFSKSFIPVFPHMIDVKIAPVTGNRLKFYKMEVSKVTNISIRRNDTHKDSKSVLNFGQTRFAVRKILPILTEYTNTKQKNPV